MDDSKKIISEDNISIKSSESVTTSGEYEIVPSSIEADINHQSTFIHEIIPLSPVPSIGDMTELQKNMDEVIHEMDLEKTGELIF